MKKLIVYFVVFISFPFLSSVQPALDIRKVEDKLRVIVIIV